MPGLPSFSFICWSRVYSYAATRNIQLTSRWLANGGVGRCTDIHPSFSTSSSAQKVSAFVQEKSRYPTNWILYSFNYTSTRSRPVVENTDILIQCFQRFIPWSDTARKCGVQSASRVWNHAIFHAEDKPAALEQTCKCRSFGWRFYVVPVQLVFVPTYGSCNSSTLQNERMQLILQL